MQEKDFFNFLKNITTSQYKNEISFLSIIIPEFISILGYDKTNLFFEKELTLGRDYRLRADAVISANRIARPWLLIETKLPRKYEVRYIEEWIRQLKTYQISSDSEYAVLLSPEFLFIIYKTSKKDVLLKQYFLEILTLDQAVEIYTFLARPEKLPDASSEQASMPTTHSIESDNFKLDLGVYSKLLESVILAKTNDEKKKSLESLARTLLESIPFLSCKYSNLRTRSSEIDIVVQNNGSNKRTIFDEFGRYCLVECKNWKSSVGAVQVRDFIGKLQKSQISLGIIFAKNGISGEQSGADALREIHAAFDTSGLYILVASAEDLRNIEHGTSFYDILDNKMDALRFDL